MREAITQFVERKEKRKMFRQDTLKAWEDYCLTGQHVTADEADAWLINLEQGIHWVTGRETKALYVLYCRFARFAKLCGRLAPATRTAHDQKWSNGQKCAVTVVLPKVQKSVIKRRVWTLNLSDFGVEKMPRVLIFNGLCAFVWCGLVLVVVLGLRSQGSWVRSPPAAPTLPESRCEFQRLFCFLGLLPQAHLTSAGAWPRVRCP